MLNGIVFEEGGGGGGVWIDVFYFWNIRNFKVIIL